MNGPSAESASSAVKALPGALRPTPIVDPRLLNLLMERGTWPADRAEHAAFVLHHALEYCRGDRALLEEKIIEIVKPGAAPWQFLHRLIQMKMAGRLEPAITAAEKGESHG